MSKQAKAEQYVKGRLVLSKLIVIIKDKLKMGTDGKTFTKRKRRLILNLKRSGVTAASINTERPELPRVLDAIFAAMKLMRARRGKKLRQIVLDFRNAFFQFPVSPAEQRFFATRLKKSVFVWTRCVQGSRGAPLVCGRCLALAMRLCFGLLEDGRGSASTYVDDPLSTYIGTEAEQEEAICVAPLVF